MTNQPKNILPAWLAAIAIMAVLSRSIPCSAQEADANHSAKTVASRAANSSPLDSSARGAHATEALPADPSTTPGVPPGAGGQSRVAGLAGRVSSFNRNGPTRETWTTIDLGTKYVKAVLGGYFSESNSATYRGERHRDIPIDRLFSGDQSTVPASEWTPGLLTNARTIS
jgi:hypothetical protein